MASKWVVIALVTIAIVGTLAITTSTQARWADTPTLDALSCPSTAIPSEEAATTLQYIPIANNCFAVNFYRQISNNNDNIFFSPISMYAAFSMASEGAKGKTASQLQDVFGFESDKDLRHDAVAELMSTLNRPDPDVTILIANSLWLAEWFEPYDSYLDTVRDIYLSDIDNVNFLDGGVDQINRWAAKKTQGKIPYVLSPNVVDKETTLVLLNAIYFKGTWATQFSEKYTNEADFWTGTQKVKTDFMSMEKVFDYTKSNRVQVLNMPYNGYRFSMLVMLPTERNGLNYLEKIATPEQINRWKEDLSPTLVDVLLPKFEIETNYDLIQPLRSLGTTDIFNRDISDLSGIVDMRPGESLHVAVAGQKAYVQVNEEGTEAAAVTAVTEELRLVSNERPPVPVPFIADHPFLFLIQDNESGTILFMGRVSDPSSE